MKRAINSEGQAKKIEYFKKAIEIWEPADGIEIKVRAYLELGKAYMEIKEYDKALTELKKASDLLPENGLSYYYTGIIKKEQGNEKEAILEFNKAVKSNPKMDNAYVELAQIYEKSKDYIKAIEAFEKALKINPFDYSYSQKLYEYYKITGQQDKMLDELDRGFNISRKGIQYAIGKITRSYLPEVLRIPVIYYDYYSDGSNPNFQYKHPNGTYFTKKEGYVMDMKKPGMLGIKTEGGDNKYFSIENATLYGMQGNLQGNDILTVLKFGMEIRFQVDTKDKKSIVAIEDSSKDFRGFHWNNYYNMVMDYLSDKRKPLMNLYKWDAYNYRINEWFMPSGLQGKSRKEKKATQFIHDFIEDKWVWTGLKNYQKRSNEFVSKFFNENDPMKNIVIYDYLDFKLKSIEGDEENPIGIYVYDSSSFFPLNGKGFMDTVEMMETNINYNFAMELHSTFRYTGNEYFKVSGNDDLWLFIDGKLQADLGAWNMYDENYVESSYDQLTDEEVLPASLKKVDITKIPDLEIGKEYTWDLFFAERQSPGSSLYLEFRFQPKKPELLNRGVHILYDSFIVGQEEVNIRIFGDRKNLQTWEVLIINSKGLAVKKFKGDGRMKEEFTWNGKDENKNFVRPGEVFTIFARGVDNNWFEWESNIEKITAKKTIVKVGDQLTLRDITFSPYSASLTDKAKVELMRIVRLLKDNLNIKILIKGHVATYTGSGWNAERLMLLSENRALAVMRFLVKEGIDPNRLQAKGYGDTEPLSKKQTAQERAKNRRVVFEIISLD